MKKMYSMLLVFAMLVTGCAGADNQTVDGTTETEEPADALGIEDIQEDTETQDVEGSTDAEAFETEQSNIEEQVLLENDYVKMTATELVYDESGEPALKLLIENLSDIDLTISAKYTAINNVMVDQLMSVDVVAGEEVSDELGFHSEELQSYGIGSIGNIEVVFKGTDMASWDNVFETDVVTIPTNVNDTYVQEYPMDGEVIVDQDGIKMVGLGLGEDLMGPLLNTAIENSMDKAVKVEAVEVSVNGFTVDTVFSADILPGKVAYPEISFFSGDLAKNDITEIKTIQMKIKVMDVDSLETIVETDSIEMVFE